MASPLGGKRAAARSDANSANTETRADDFHGRFVWYELMAANVETAKAFYTRVLGWGTENAAMPGMPYTLFTAAGSSVCGVMGLPESAKAVGARPSWLGYVGVDDVAVAAARVRRLGGVVHVPPQDVSDISRFAIFADPQHATLALLQWRKPRRDKRADPATPGRIRWHELITGDCEAAFGFLSALFGWERGSADPDPTSAYQQFCIGGKPIGAILTKPATVAVPFWLYYFNTGDIDAAAKRVKASGGEVLEGPTAVPDGSWILQCTDPDGALFALVGTRGKTMGYFERTTPHPIGGPYASRWSW
jgi:uncharacterized protein